MRHSTPGSLDEIAYAGAVVDDEGDRGIHSIAAKLVVGACWCHRHLPNWDASARRVDQSSARFLFFSCYFWSLLPLELLLLGLAPSPPK